MCLSSQRQKLYARAATYRHKINIMFSVSLQIQTTLSIPAPHVVQNLLRAQLVHSKVRRCKLSLSVILLLFQKYLRLDPTIPYFAPHHTPTVNNPTGFGTLLTSSAPLHAMEEIPWRRKTT